MQRELTASRHVSSVSDLYFSDEISVLLEEIQSLEPSSYRLEDFQDFEIAGSQTGGAGGVGGGRAASSIAELETPGDAATIHSWDSHANYKPNVSSPARAFDGIVLYYDESHFKTRSGALRLLLVATTFFSLIWICTAGLFRVNLLLLPYAGRLRFMIFANLFTFLTTCGLLFLDVTHSVYLFPVDWGKICAIIYTGFSVLYLVSSSLLLHLTYIYEKEFTWVPKSTNWQIFYAGIFGLVCSLETILLSMFTKWEEGQYKPVNEDPSSVVTLQDRKIIRYSPSPCPSLQPVAGTPHTPHWVGQDNILPSYKGANAMLA